MNIDSLTKYLADIQKKLNDLDKLADVKIEEDDFNKLSSSIQELGLVTQEVYFKNEVKEVNERILNDLSKIVTNTKNIESDTKNIKSEIQSNSKKITDLVDSNNNLTQKNLKIVWENIKEEINNSNTSFKKNIESNKDEIIKTLKTDISTLKYEISMLKTNIEKNTTETKNLKEEIEKIGKQLGISQKSMKEEIKDIFKNFIGFPKTESIEKHDNGTNNSGTNTQNGN